MKVFDYQNGVVHIQIDADGRKIDVMRIQPSKGKPFVIGSSFEGQVGNPKIPTDSPRTAHTIEYLNKGSALMGSTLNYPASLTHFKKDLRLLWMSNGVFFGGEKPDKNGNYYHEGAKLYIQGPVVMGGKIISDISTVFVRDVTKRSRWYYGQKNQRPYYGQAVGGLQASQLYQQTSCPSIIGGGAPLIKDGLRINKKTELQKKALWEGTLGFDDQFDKAVGPIIASNETGSVNYLIFAHRNFFPSWEAASLYLRDSSRFLADIKHKSDGHIHNAVVYDGGGSPQLWIRDADHAGIVISSARPTPHRICLWAS